MPLATAPCYDEPVLQVTVGVSDTFNTLWVMDYIKGFAWQRWKQQWWSSDHNSLTFSLKL